MYARFEFKRVRVPLLKRKKNNNTEFNVIVDVFFIRTHRVHGKAVLSYLSLQVAYSGSKGYV